METAFNQECRGIFGDRKSLKCRELETDERKTSGFLYTAKFGDYLQGCVFTDKASRPFAEKVQRGARIRALFCFIFTAFENSGTEVCFNRKVAINDSDEIQSEIKSPKTSTSNESALKTNMKWNRKQIFRCSQNCWCRNVCLKAATIFIEIGKQKALINRLATGILVSFEATKRRLRICRYLRQCKKNMVGLKFINNYEGRRVEREFGMKPFFPSQGRRRWNAGRFPEINLSLEIEEGKWQTINPQLPPSWRAQDWKNRPVRFVDGKDGDRRLPGCARNGRKFGGDSSGGD